MQMAEKFKGKTPTTTDHTLLTILFLWSSREAVLVESALGHLGEDLLHDVPPVPILQVGQQIRAVSKEISIEKMIHEENLADYDEQIEKFTEDELRDIEIVFANGLSEVLNNCDPTGKYIVSIHSNFLNIINHNNDRVDFVVGSTLSISIAYLFLFIFSPSGWRVN